MIPSNNFSGSGRKKSLSGGMIFLIVLLLLIQTSVLFFAVRIAVKTKVKVVWLDPYLQLEIQGADGYAVTKPVFDEDGFRSELEETLRSFNSSLSDEEAGTLSEKVMESITYEFYVKTADGSAGVDVNGEEEQEDEEESEASLQDELDLPVPGISNGDTVTVYANVSDEVWSDLRDQGYYLAFECDPVAMTAENLPEANPYDPFEDLSVSFTGMNGIGTVEIYYNGSFPFNFTAEPSERLQNGDTVEIKVSFNDDYDLDSIVEDYHIMPVSLSQEYTVSGLYMNPNGIEEFSDETREMLMREGREAARALLDEEYNDDEHFVIEDAGMYFAVSNDTEQNNENTENTDYDSGNDGTETTAGTEESAGTGIRNYLYCLFRINYTNNSGDELSYYYYIRFQNLMLDDSNEVIADFREIENPHKPSLPLIGEALGDGSEVSVGFLTFRSLAGYESLDELISRVITPLETTFTVTSFDQ